VSGRAGSDHFAATFRAQLPDSASSSSDPDGHVDDLAAKVGKVLGDVFGTELVRRTVEILRQLPADVVRAWLRAPVGMISRSSSPDRELLD
jgi:hypothetical protein